MRPHRSAPRFAAPRRVRHRAQRLGRWGVAGAAAGFIGLLALSAAAAPAAAPGAALPAAATAVSIAAGAGGGLDLRVGTKVVAQIPLATPALRRGAPQVHEWEIDGHRIAEVRVPVRGRPSEEVWVGDLNAKPVRVIWTGFAGPRDADEETALVLEVGEDRIVEYQTAAHVVRCDGESVRLLPRAWDFASGRFRPIVSTPPPPASQKLTARRGDPAMPAGRPLGGFHFVAASTTAAAGTDARGLSAPTALDDGDARTFWSEGLGGDGRGEFLTARASAGRYRVRGLRIVPGDASTPAAFKAKNRIKALALALGPEPQRRFEVEFPDDPAAAAGKSHVAYWIPLPTPIESACLTVTIRDVYRGSEAGPAGGGGTTAISDLEVFTEIDEPAGVERLVADTAAGADCASRVPLLVALGEPAVLPAAQTILGASGVGRECLVDALSRIDATLKSGVALDALAAALVHASSNEEKLILRTLRRATTPPVRAIADLLASPRVASEDRIRAARVLGELGGPDAIAALLAAAGAGDADVRLGVVQALGRSTSLTVPALVAAIEAAHGAAAGEAASRREADLLRALAVLARRPSLTAGDRGATPPAAPKLEKAAPVASEKAAPTAADTATAQDPGASGAGGAIALAALRRSLASGRSFEVQARALMALGAVGDTSVVGDLSAVRDHADDAVLRFLATRELGELGGPAARGALRTALDDRDPRVRETAAQGLGKHPDGASEALLIEAAKEEPWPFARRAQIEALSRTCGAPARDLLIRAMERDVDEVRRAALVGLVRCRDERARPTLITTLKARRASATLRELAAALLGELGDRQVTSDLADILGALVTEAEGDLAIEGVAVSALRSLGHLGGPVAARAAAGLAADTRHPYRHVAVDMLGEICDGDIGTRALMTVRAGSDPSLAAAAGSALQHCEKRPPAPKN